jgi:kynurenine formamidase
MSWIDITGTIEKGMWHYKDLPEVKIRKVTSIENEGYDEYEFLLTSLTSTYLETEAHLIPMRRSIDELSPEDFIRDALIIKLKSKLPLEHIEREDLIPYEDKIKAKDALIISTGWEDYWNNDIFIKQSPHFTMEAMEWIVERRVSILGGDIPCFDHPGREVGVNKILFGSEALILAPLINLKGIQVERARLYAFPLKIKGVCATPCRAILEV